MTYIIHIESKAEHSEAIETALDELAMQVSQYEGPPEETDQVLTDIYFETAEAAEARLADIEEAVSKAVGKAVVGRIIAVAEQDWAEKWKEFYHTERVTPRIVIRPSWESFDANDGDCVIELDPGMSFGTGQHPTTRGCLSFIDVIADRMQGASLLDIGCGSGVLSIAAAKLGFSGIMAIDNDPIAVEAAKRNSAVNEVAELVECSQMGANELAPDRTFDVVVANMLTPILEELAKPITAALAHSENARLILSGIALDQYDRILTLYGEHGFTEHQTVSDGNWRTGLFRREDS